MPLNKRNHGSTKKSSNVFEQIFSSTKNLTLFRYKPLEYVDRCQSSHQLNNEKTITTPMCLGRSWLKKRLTRPISFDFERIDNDQIPLWLHRVGTRRLFFSSAFFHPCSSTRTNTNEDILHLVH